MKHHSRTTIFITRVVLGACTLTLAYLALLGWAELIINYKEVTRYFVLFPYDTNTKLNLISTTLITTLAAIAYGYFCVRPKTFLLMIHCLLRK